MLNYVNEGIESKERDIFAFQEYWMNFEEDNVILSLCPLNNTNVIITRTGQYLCTLNRDSKLCEKCMEGCSESLNSTKCTCFKY